MNYSFKDNGTRLKTFMSMCDGYLDICSDHNTSSYDVAIVMDKVWGKTMEEWGWDVSEFLAQLITVYENRN